MIYLLFCAIITTAIEHLRYGFCIEHLRYGFCCAWNIKIDNFRFAAIFQVKIPFQDGTAPLLNRELHLPLNRSSHHARFLSKLRGLFMSENRLKH